MKDFDLELALDKVEFVCTDGEFNPSIDISTISYLPDCVNGYRLVVVYKSDILHINGKAGFYYDDGKMNCGFCPGNLKMKSIKKEGWINIYNPFGKIYHRSTGGRIYDNEDDAKSNILNGERYSTTIKIEWEE